MGRNGKYDATLNCRVNSVAIYDLGCMPHNKVTPEEEAKVLYAAMTRATEQLLISYHRESVFTKRCEALA